MWPRLFLVLALFASGRVADAAPLTHALSARFRIQQQQDSAAVRTVFFSGQDLSSLKFELAQHHLLAHGSNHTLWVRGAVSELAAFANHPAVERMELAPALHPLLDKSVAQIGALAVHNGQGVKTAQNGNGVMVGLLDTGIDLTHPAFLDAAGHSRILAVWDQDGVGTPPDGFDYGLLCTHADIEQNKCPVVDTVGHGTHVAGILAGSLAPHIGLAPNAQLVVVKSQDFTDVAGAVAWMFAMADSQHQPIVVNLSIGGHLGAHDGHSQLEQALGELEGSGKIIVAAAGNDGDQPIHLAATATTSNDSGNVLALPTPGTATTYIEIWQTAGNSLGFSLSVTGSDGNAVGQVNLVDPGSGETFDFTSADGNHGHISYAKDAINAQGKTHHFIMITRDPTVAASSTDNWTFSTTGQGSFDAWLSTDSGEEGLATFSTATGTGLMAADTNTTLTIPSTAPRVLSVGSFVTRNQWVAENGENYSIANANLSALSTFSSAGPTADPSFTGSKPELIAPGQLIVAPLSAQASSYFGPTLSITGPNGSAQFAVLQGTSMSAPHVAGTIALMLGSDSSLTPEQVKNILTTTATHESGDASAPDVRYGYGRVDALAAVQSVEGNPPPPASHGCNAVIGRRMAAEEDDWDVVFALGLIVVAVRVFRARSRWTEKRS